MRITVGIASLLLTTTTLALQLPTQLRLVVTPQQQRQPTFLSARRTLTKERPLQLQEEDFDDEKTLLLPNDETVSQHSSSSSLATTLGVTAATAVTVWTAATEQAAAAGIISSGSLDPKSFAPVCSVSDGFYRFLQSATVSLVGEDSFVEYGPLIAGGLLRIRLELCVIESFFNEAVGPFIAQKGISWILPLLSMLSTRRRHFILPNTHL